jgi:hypothetical protein
MACKNVYLQSYKKHPFINRVMAIKKKLDVSMQHMFTTITFSPLLQGTVNKICHPPYTCAQL